MSLKVSATVILYNPEDEIFDNILSYAKDVDNLIVVDNSTTHNDNLIKRLEEFNNLIYINNNANLGIATALNIGCDKAIEKESDWILTMDQDSRFINFKHYKECLLHLEDKDNTALLCANTNWSEEQGIPDNPSFDGKDQFTAITSANFLNLKLFEQIGRFEDKLFIDLVDYDYCLRVQVKNFKILYFKDALVQHSLGAVFKRKNLITRKIRTKVEHNPQRVYYFARNYLYTAKMYGKRFPKEIGMLKTINILFVHEVTKIILYEDDKFKKLYAKLLGLYHFVINQYGKQDI